LTQRLQGAARELRQLVEEQHAVVSERRLAGPSPKAAADQRLQGGGVVWVAEWPAAGDAAVAQLAGQRGDHRDLESFLWIQWRQQAGQTCREHRLAGAGWADHQEIVAAGRRDLDRALGGFLALDVGEVGIADIVATQGGGGW